MKTRVITDTTNAITNLRDSKECTFLINLDKCPRNESCRMFATKI